MNLKRKFQVSMCKHSFSIMSIPTHTSKRNEVWEKCSNCGVIRIGEITFKRYFDPRKEIF